MIDLLSRLDVINSALLSSFKWNDIVAGGIPKWVLRSPAAIPMVPFLTNRRKISKRVSCANAAKELTAFFDFIFPIISKCGGLVKLLGSNLYV